MLYDLDETAATPSASGRPGQPSETHPGDTSHWRLPYSGQTHYDVEISGLRRRLPVVRVNQNLWIASFVMLGDVQLVNVVAGALAARLAGLDFAYLVGPEAKVVPLLQATATLLGHRRYVVCRKSVKSYMQDPVVVEVQSITTAGKQRLVLDGPDAQLVRDQKVIILDDVVSTGGSLTAVEALLAKAGARIVARAAALQEGDFYQDSDRPLITLGRLPVFVKSTP
ncbi:MAG: adenine phosphoribosyltransferase [Limnochordaceae bacterium]|nr:adenine phosphoribosyltransferase [Limnochordaceae bacterium]